MRRQQQPLKVGDLVTYDSQGIYRITQIDSNPHNPLAGPVVTIERLTTGNYKPVNRSATGSYGRVRKVYNTYRCKPANFDKIRAAIQKKYQDQLTALDAFIAEIRKQGVPLP
ncbi:hypothetical protein C4588_06870 [Candidatus Parcubacteria bacterium]|nr:MAG: hypothetical protein C4588_06870 [Candidatus Parcubacteria bacterium]